jgi:hypothetical protein
MVQREMTLLNSAMIWVARKAWRLWGLSRDEAAKAEGKLVALVKAHKSAQHLYPRRSFANLSCMLANVPLIICKSRTAFAQLSHSLRPALAQLSPSFRIASAHLSHIFRTGFAQVSHIFRTSVVESELRRLHNPSIGVVCTIRFDHAHA